MSLTAKILAGLLVLVAIDLGVVYVRALHTELDERTQQLDDARQGIVDRDDTINRLQADAADKAKQQQQLDRARSAIAAQLDTALQENRRLRDENAEVRAWADTPLPFDVARLHNTPAQTGAGDYAAAVSDRAALRAPSDGAAD
ncbi:Rz-like lysis system protein LysB [Paraburkholderia acidipaludis]|uniref:Rz-like lysis system protein LysB n=1 Tax=Paraburkholderia acidipaludis TaxID=660537 RepID=UPI0005BDA62C|nr:Rz-like lysis system protein LysB [Paraburkholderia acidipaludis]